MLIIFSSVYLLSVYLYGKICDKVFGPFFNQVVCFIIVEF